MICKVKRTIEKYNLLDGVASIAVGVSGGADSMCLLEILSKLKEEYGIILKVVHVNHNIRGEEALRDQNLVESYCRDKNLECLVYSVDVPALAKEMGIGEEECGRIKRYEAFSKADCDLIATAHSLSDSIETMIFNLVRGTGVKGLCGIPPRRDNIIRPLIECTRNEIEAYCDENEIPYITDSTNLTDDYTRNFIRHNIVLNFARINENYFSSLNGAIETLRNENDFLDDCKDALISSSKNGKVYKTSIFACAHPAVRRRSIAHILEKQMNKNVEKRHIDLVDEAIMKNEGKVEIAKDFYAVVSDGILSFENKVHEISEWNAEYTDGKFMTPVGTFHIEEVISPEHKNAIDADKLKGNLHMSSRKDGDRFFSKKRKNTKTLKKLFNEARIPAHERNAVAILRDRENIVWIDGFGTDGKYLPDINTKNVLIIKKEG